MLIFYTKCIVRVSVRAMRNLYLWDVYLVLIIYCLHLRSSITNESTHYCLKVQTSSLGSLCVPHLLKVDMCYVIIMSEVVRRQDANII